MRTMRNACRPGRQQVKRFFTTSLLIQGTLRSRNPGQLLVGDSATTLVRVDDAKVSAFAALTGDLNPVHLDEVVASKTRFGQRIAHGLLVAGAIPAIFATCFPGSVYRSQTLSFVAPVYINDQVKTTIVVAKIVTQPRNLGSLISCSTTCQVQRTGIWADVIRGSADVLIPMGSFASS